MSTEESALSSSQQEALRNLNLLTQRQEKQQVSEAGVRFKKSMVLKVIGGFTIVFLVAAVLFTVEKNSADENVSKQLTGINQGEQDQGNAEMPVKSTASVPANTLERSQLTIVGKVVPERMSNVSARTSGVVHKVLVKEGAKVSEGDIIATLESELQKIQLDLAYANLEMSMEHLHERTLSLKVTEKDYERARVLAEKNLVSVAKLDELHAKVNQQRSEIKSAESAIEVARLQIDSMKHALEYTIIRAPFAGQISEVFVSPGESISPILSGGISSKPGVCTIVDPNSMQVEVEVDEEHFEFVQQATETEVTFSALPKVKLDASVANIASTVDAARGTFKVTVSLQPGDQVLLSNMAAKVTFKKSDLSLVKR